MTQQDPTTTSQSTQATTTPAVVNPATPPVATGAVDPVKTSTVAVADTAITQSSETAGAPKTGTPAASNPQHAATILEATKKFDIPKSIQQKYEELIVMVLQTKSMDDKERQYWFHILPVMNQAQIDKLQTILVNEKVKLAAIDAKYGKKVDLDKQAEISELKQKQLKSKMDNLKVVEAEAEKDEAEKEAALLAELENL